MRLAHHLRRHPASRVFYFRLSVPLDLRGHYGATEIRRGFPPSPPGLRPYFELAEALGEVPWDVLTRLSLLTPNFAGFRVATGRKPR